MLILKIKHHSKLTKLPIFIPCIYRSVARVRVLLIELLHHGVALYAEKATFDFRTVGIALDQIGCQSTATGKSHFLLFILLYCNMDDASKAMYVPQVVIVPLWNGVLFFLRLPNGQYGPVSQLSRSEKCCTGPFNWGEAHCAGEKVKRKIGLFQRKSL